MIDQANENIDLRSLESRIDELISTVGKLKIENTILKDQQASLSSERARLVNKMEQAKARIESMMARLKTMESHS